MTNVLSRGPQYRMLVDYYFKARELEGVEQAIVELAPEWILTPGLDGKPASTREMVLRMLYFCKLKAES